MEDAEYLLGHNQREWDRLAEQHALWGDQLIRELTTAGIGDGQRILEVGCGAGDLLADLAALNPSGRTLGLEQDPTAADHASIRLGDRATVVTGDLLTDDLQGPHDAIVARWVLSFLPDPDAAVARLTSALAPGGILAVQDYNHDGLGIWPRHSAIDRVIEGYRAAYRARGGDLWIGARLPGLFHDHGLVDIRTNPHAMGGGTGSEVWRWVGRFLVEHLDTLLDAGHLSDDEADAFRRGWAERCADPRAVLFSPLQVTVIGRRG